MADSKSVVGGSNPQACQIKPAIGGKDMNKIAKFFGSLATFYETRAELRRLRLPGRVGLSRLLLFTAIGLGAILGEQPLVAFRLQRRTRQVEER